MTRLAVPAMMAAIAALDWALKESNVGSPVFHRDGQPIESFRLACAGDPREEVSDQAG